MKESIFGAVVGLGIGLLIFVAIFTFAIKKNHNEFKATTEIINHRIYEIDMQISEIITDIKTLRGASHKEIEFDTARQFLKGPIRDPFMRMK